jgi:hypothetical protein
MLSSCYNLLKRLKVTQPTNARILYNSESPESEADAMHIDLTLITNDSTADLL